LAARRTTKTAAASLESALGVRRRIGSERDGRGHAAELGRICRIKDSTSVPSRYIAKRWRSGGTRSATKPGKPPSASDLASVLRLRGDLERRRAASAIARGESQDSRRRSAMTATTLHGVALITAAKGDRASAEALFRKVMDTHRKALGESHRSWP
jgi:hypothetical protein